MKPSLVIALVLGIAGGIAHADAPPRRASGPLRQALMARFDRNHDGRLEPRERRQAARALRKLANRLEQRQSRRQALIERYDLDGDGRVGPREVPPAVRDRLRRLDRNGNGWVEPNEMP